jgi:hypothetical protein
MYMYMYIGTYVYIGICIYSVAYCDRCLFLEPYGQVCTGTSFSVSLSEVSQLQVTTEAM